MDGIGDDDKEAAAAILTTSGRWKLGVNAFQFSLHRQPGGVVRLNLSHQLWACRE
jgi:hypothetical protein